MNNIHIGIIGSPEDVVFKDKVIKIDNDRQKVSLSMKI